MKKLLAFFFFLLLVLSGFFTYQLGIWDEDIKPKLMDFLELDRQMGETFKDSVETAKKSGVKIEEKEKIATDLRKEQKLHEDILNRQKAEMDSIKAEVESLLSPEKRDDSENLDALAKIYESMKPAEVAALALNIKDELLAKILVRMKTRKAGKIMDEITKTDPQKSAVITGEILKLKMEEE